METLTVENRMKVEAAVRDLRQSLGLLAHPVGAEQAQAWATAIGRAAYKRSAAILGDTCRGSLAGRPAKAADRLVLLAVHADCLRAAQGHPIPSWMTCALFYPFRSALSA